MVEWLKEHPLSKRHMRAHLEDVTYHLKENPHGKAHNGHIVEKIHFLAQPHTWSQEKIGVTSR